MIEWFMRTSSTEDIPLGNVVKPLNMPKPQLSVSTDRTTTSSPHPSVASSSRRRPLTATQARRGSEPLRKPTLSAFTESPGPSIPKGYEPTDGAYDDDQLRKLSFYYKALGPSTTQFQRTCLHRPLSVPTPSVDLISASEADVDVESEFLHQSFFRTLVECKLVPNRTYRVKGHKAREHVMICDTCSKTNTGVLSFVPLVILHLWLESDYGKKSSEHCRRWINLPFPLGPLADSCPPKLAEALKAYGYPCVSDKPWLSKPCWHPMSHIMKSAVHFYIPFHTAAARHKSPVSYRAVVGAEVSLFISKEGSSDKILSIVTTTPHLPSSEKSPVPTIFWSLSAGIDAQRILPCTDAPSVAMPLLENAVISVRSHLEGYEAMRTFAVEDLFFDDTTAASTIRGMFLNDRGSAISRALGPCRNGLLWLELSLQRLQHSVKTYQSLQMTCEAAELKTMLDNLDASRGHLKLLQGHVEQISEDVQLLLERSTERSLKRLSIATVLFLPPSVVSGYFGMDAPHAIKVFWIIVPSVFFFVVALLLWDDRAVTIRARQGRMKRKPVMRPLPPPTL